MTKRFLPFLLLLPSVALGVQNYEQLYGVEDTIHFAIYDSSGGYDTTQSDDGDDATLYCGDASGSASTNDYVAATNGDTYKLTLTAAELQCPILRVEVEDSNAAILYVYTYGDINAYDKTRGIAAGEAQGGSENTIQLASATSFADDILNNHIVCVVGGTGAGQCRLIESAANSGWVSSTDTATVTQNWVTNPASGSEYVVRPANQATVAELGQFLDDTQGFVDSGELTTALAGLAQTTDVDGIGDAIIELTDGTSPVHALGMTLATGTCSAGTTTTCDDPGLTEGDDYWNGDQITFSSGNGQNQARCIDDFDATNDRLTFSAVAGAVSAATYVISANAACHEIGVAGAGLSEAGGTGDQFTALNDLSQAEVNAAADTALVDYDAPTKAELDAGFAALNDPSATAVRDSIMQYLLDNGITFESMMCYIGAILAGESDYDPNVPDAEFYDPTGTDLRVTVTYGASGSSATANDRTTVVLSNTNCGSN